MCAVRAGRPVHLISRRSRVGWSGNVWSFVRGFSRDHDQDDRRQDDAREGELRWCRSRSHRGTVIGFLHPLLL